MSRTGDAARWAVPTLLLLAGPAFAQDHRPTVADIPPIERQTADFYGAIATGRVGVQVAWSTDHTEVPLDSETLLTLTVRNAANPSELTKPDLPGRDDFARDFQVVAVPDAPPQADAAEVRFAYRLRPRALGTATVPALRFRYYRPDLPDGRRFPTTYADALTLTVTPPKPKVTPTVAAIPLDAPESFFALTDETPPFLLGRFGWLVPVASVPVVVVGWVFAWRRLFPDAARMARLRRSRAARVAFHRLKMARTSVDPVEDTAVAVRDYLVTRFGIPPTAQTPIEVADGLRLVDRETLVDGAEAFLRACDAARFAATHDNGLSLTLQAEALVAVWAGDSA